MMNSATIGCDRLWVEFHRRADRFHHEIHCRSRDGIAAILSSQEGASDDRWPPSPPLQSLHMESQPGGIQTAMLIGMAGRSHWSLSVEADADGGRLLFDIACRTSEEPIWMGSTYEFLPGIGAAHQIIEFEPHTPAALRRQGPSRASITAPTTNGPLPRTIRWGYFVALRPTAVSAKGERDTARLTP